MAWGWFLILGLSNALEMITNDSTSFLSCTSPPESYFNSLYVYTTSSLLYVMASMSGNDYTNAYIECPQAPQAVITGTAHAEYFYEQWGQQVYMVNSTDNTPLGNCTWFFRHIYADVVYTIRTQTYFSCTTAPDCVALSRGPCAYPLAGSCGGCLCGGSNVSSNYPQECTTCTASPTTPIPIGSPTLSPTGSPTRSPTGSPTRSPTGSPTLSPTAPTLSPTTPTLSPTGSPTLSPTAPALSPTRSPLSPTTLSPTKSPTLSPVLLSTGSLSGGKLSSGEVVGIVIAVIGVLACLLILWCCISKRRNLVQMIKSRRTKMAESRVLDPREVALESTIRTCQRILKGPKMTAHNKLLVQAAIESAKEDKQALTALSSSGLEMLSIPNSFCQNELKLYNMEDFDHVKFLSQGEGGTADLYRHKVTSKEVAIKVLHDVETLQAEVKVWQTVGIHPNVARLIGVATFNGRQRGIIMEYYSGGSLFSHPPEFAPKELVRIAIDLARGIQHLHLHKVIHRDLAPRNILLAGDRRAAITDFGLSRQLDDNDNYQMITETKLPWRTLAPEIIGVESGKRVFTEKTDIWALGVTLWELATQMSAYSAELRKDPLSVLHQKIGSGAVTLDMSPVIINHPNVATTVIGCLQHNPVNRPSAEQLRWLLKDDSAVEASNRERYLSMCQESEYA